MNRSLLPNYGLNIMTNNATNLEEGAYGSFTKKQLNGKTIDNMRTSIGILSYKKCCVNYYLKMW